LAAASLANWVIKSIEYNACCQEVTRVEPVPDAMTTAKPADAGVPIKRVEETLDLVVKKDLQELKATSHINPFVHISKADIVELKSLKAPPEAVVTLLQCVQILHPFGTDAEEVGWAGAKKMLGDVRLLRALQEYRRESATQEEMQRVKDILDTDDVFVGENLKKVSKAAFGLLAWVRGVVEPSGLEKANVMCPGELEVLGSKSGVHPCNYFW